MSTKVGHRRGGETISGLLPWSQVAAAWNAMSGERITAARVGQIAAAAERKIADGACRLIAMQHSDELGRRRPMRS